MKEVVIVGGGVGGTLVANQLAQKVADQLAAKTVHITLVTNSGNHVYQPLYLYMAFGQALPEEAARPERDILHPKVDLVVQDAVRIDPTGQTVMLADGRALEYDFLVIATGSRPAPEQIPGMAEGAHWFYTEESALKLQQALFQFSGGRVVITVGVPHKCPVAPLEFTFMLDDWLRERGIRSATEMTYTYPIGRLHSLEPVAEWARPAMASRDIKTQIFFNVETVDPVKRTITSMEGETLAYDLLVAIPPHTGQAVIRDSGLGDAGGWIATDRHSLLMEGSDNIYVLGDATNLPISKAGSTAHFEGDVVAANLAARLKGGVGAHRYDGKVFCFIETGLKEATYVEFAYDHPPNPKQPSEMIHWFKAAYNRMYWLTPAGIL